MRDRSERTAARPTAAKRPAQRRRGGRWAMRALLLGIALHAAIAAPAEPEDASGPRDLPPTEDASGPRDLPPADDEETTAEEDPRESGPVVDRIQWDGVEAVDEDFLEQRILTTAQPRLELRFWRPERRLNEFDLEEDLDRIVAAYREVGYFSAEVDARVEPAGEDRVVVAFRVREGTPVRLRAWTLEIVPPEQVGPAPSEAERERLRSAVDVEPGRIFGSRLYRERRSALLETSAALGFPSARIAGGAEVDPRAGTARVDWTLRLGPRTEFGAIRIEGLDGVEQHVVRRELAFAPGDRYSPSALRTSERRLVDTGLFRSVVIGRASPRPGSEPTPGVFPIEIRLDEAPPRSFRASVGYGTEDGPRGETSLVWRNFLGDARRLDLRAFASFLDAGFEATLGQPYLGGWHGGRGARGDLAVSALRQSRPGYEAFVTGATGIVTLFPGGDREGPWSVSVGPGYELADVLDFEIDLGVPLRGPRESVIVNLYSAVRFDAVDDPLDPSRGFRADLRNELGGHPIGSDLDYQLWQLDLRAYWSLGPVVWAGRAAVTTLDPIGDGLAAVPVTRRLYAGGTNSIRGFGFQKLGPTDSGNDPIGGLSRMELGVELRVPVWRRFGLVGFVDAGDVRTDTFSWRPRDLRFSAGPGLRVETPVGPIRLDVGFLLNRPPNVDPWRIHLSVGHAF